VIAFLWKSTRGNRLDPWNSPYLKWRIETYWGIHASSITPQLFWRFTWEHRAELWRFLRWASRTHAQTPRIGV
jgi:hypothetical protein